MLEYPSYVKARNYPAYEIYKLNYKGLVIYIKNVTAYRN